MQLGPCLFDHGRITSKNQRACRQCLGALRGVNLSEIEPLLALPDAQKCDVCRTEGRQDGLFKTFVCTFHQKLVVKASELMQQGTTDFERDRKREWMPIALVRKCAPDVLKALSLAAGEPIPSPEREFRTWSPLIQFVYGCARRGESVSGVSIRLVRISERDWQSGACFWSAHFDKGNQERAILDLSVAEAYDVLTTVGKLTVNDFERIFAGSRKRFCPYPDCLRDTDKGAFVPSAELRSGCS